MAIVQADFAEECVRQALYCGVNPHYMLAVAQLRSGISDENDGDKFGPFRLTQSDWNANCRDAEFEFNYIPEDIKDWDSQCAIFALMVHRALNGYLLAHDANPTARELYLAQWPAAASATLSTDLTQALTATAGLVDPAAAKVIGNTPPLTIANSDQNPPVPAAGALNLSSISAARRPIAQRIADAFSALGKFQQATAVANAIAESNLNPTAHAAVGEDSWGLFQLNRNGGLGTGHAPAELVDPDKNIAIVLMEAKKFAEFTMAGSLDQAVSAFVRKVERPRDVSGETVKRLNIAQQLIS